MSDIQLPDYTLRGHTHAITNLLLPHQVNGEIPILLSADDHGTIIKWNLITRRPISTIILPTRASIVAIQLIDSRYLVSLSKDYTLRIYTWSNDIVTIDDDDSKVIFEMKVNTLNFANFTIRQLNNGMLRLCCCNTTNSEAIDIYHIDLRTMALTRQFKEIEFFESIKGVLRDAKIAKMGMVMKFVESFEDDVIFCGFESGIVIGFMIEDTKEKLIVVYVSTFHYPEPILDLSMAKPYDYNEHDQNRKVIKLLSTSTTNRIGGHSLDHINIDLSQECNNLLTFQEGNIIRLANLEIADVKPIQVKGLKINQVRSVSNSLIWSTWMGKTRIQKYYNNIDSEGIIRTFWKSKSAIIPNESSKGSLDGKYGDLDKPRYVKTASMVVFDKEYFQTLQQQNKTVSVLNRSKLRRLQLFVKYSWCIIGYEDGTISLYNIDNDI